MLSETICGNCFISCVAFLKTSARGISFLLYLYKSLQKRDFGAEISEHLLPLGFYIFIILHLIYTKDPSPEILRLVVLSSFQWLTFQVGQACGWAGKVSLVVSGSEKCYLLVFLYLAKLLLVFSLLDVSFDQVDFPWCCLLISSILVVRTGRDPATGV